MLLQVSILKSSSASTYCSLLKLHVKIVNMSYGVFHDLWTLVQGVISEVFVFKKVHINMCPILDGYGVMTA